MKMKKLYYHLKMLRIKDWIKSYFWIPLIGAFLANASLENFLFIAIIYFCATGYSFVINNYFDVEIDKRHQGKIESNKNPLAQGLITKKGTLIFLGILLIVPIILALQMNFLGFIFVSLSILASTFYSIKYFRLKEKSFLDITTHGFMFGFFPFLAGVILAGGNLNLLSILIGILFTFITANELLIHQIVDYQDDLGNTNTTVIKIGKKMSYVSLILFFIITLLCFGMMIRYFNVGQYLYWLFVLLLCWLPLYHCYQMKIRKKAIVQLFGALVKF